MDNRLTKLQWIFLEQHTPTGMSNAECEAIIDRYEVGYIQKQYFLLDYETLNPLSREQLVLGLPLSEEQERRVYQELNIDDDEALVSRRDLIKSLSYQQLGRLNALTPEARQTIVARLVDGRILGVLDEVLDAAPEMQAVSRMETNVPIRLQERLVRCFRAYEMKNLERIRAEHLTDIDQLLRVVDAGLLEPKHLVIVARELLTYEQREYWQGHTSAKQKIAIAKDLLLGINRVAAAMVEDQQGQGIT